MSGKRFVSAKQWDVGELMQIKFFGDSYDIVKKSLIAWLNDFGGWSAHPMFTEPVTGKQAAAFSNFLGVGLVSTEQLTPATDRSEYFSTAGEAGNLFLDPDTGVRIEPCRGLKSVNYVFGEELVELSHKRPDSLTLVFDQSFSRGEQAERAKDKLAYFQSYSVEGFFYSSHAPFLLLGGNSDLIRQARQKLLQVSGLPSSRFIGHAG